MNDLQLQIDLLVDGELSEDERRELLLRFESEPDAWRTCALALLEAETLRESLGGWADSETTESRVENVLVKNASSNTTTWLKRARPVVLAVVASLFVGFFIGERLVSSGFLHRSTPTIASPEELIDPVDETPRTFAEAPIPDPDETELPDYAPPSLPPPSDSPWKLVSFYGEDSETEEPAFELPCREAATPDDVWADDPMTFTSSLVESLQAPGRNVQVIKRHWSVPADDGSTIIVPVEEIVVSYPSLEDYQ